MPSIQDPVALGFSASTESIDRAQVAMLMEIARAEPRLILKGGMAMRVVVGSMRLTKDVDLDRSADISTNAIRSILRRALMSGATMAGLRAPNVDDLKTTPTTTRLRLSGTVQGSPVKFVVEVSGRTSPPAGSWRQVTVEPPPRYGIAPFSVNAYTHDMLAANKVSAAMSPNRNVPRDIFDLNDLAQAAPQGLLAEMFERRVLNAWRAQLFDKLAAVSFEQARDELMPYLEPRRREALTRSAWEEMTLHVATVVDRWLAEVHTPSGDGSGDTGSYRSSRHGA
jgi:hypothetical protein